MTLSGQRWLKRPPRGTLIDRSHSWVGPAGMRSFYALNENTGGTICDSMSNLNLLSNGFGSTNPWGVGSQTGIACTAAKEGFQAAVPSWLQLKFPVSGAFALRPLGIITNNANMFGVNFNAAYSGGSNCYQVSSGTSTGWNLNYNSAGSVKELISSVIPVIGIDAVLSFVLTSTFQTLYLNGRVIASSSNGISNPTFGSPALLQFGVTIGTASYNTNALFYWGALWNSALPASAHAAIGSNPNAIWRIFRPMNGISAFAGAAPRLVRRSLYGRAGSRGVA
jgi:hypothetical protein